MALNPALLKNQVIFPNKSIVYKLTKAALVEDRRKCQDVLEPHMKMKCMLNIPQPTQENNEGKL